MRSPKPHQIKNQQEIMKDDVTSEIHDRLLDDNDLDLAHAFNAACCEISELYRGMEALEKHSATGYIKVKRIKSRD